VQLKQRARERRRALEELTAGRRERAHGGGGQTEAGAAVASPRLQQAQEGAVQLVNFVELVVAELV
jgi:hypothetical protein